MEQYRWDPCVVHRGTDVDDFIDEYFGTSKRPFLFIAGLGFDPRSTILAKRFARIGASVSAVFIKEDRTSSMGNLVSRAESNTQVLEKVIPEHTVERVEIFGTDEAVVGGRRAVNMLDRQDFRERSDIVVDVSALSVGTSFPIIRYLVGCIERGVAKFNLHLFTVHDPQLDAAIQSISSDLPSYVHGFNDKSKLEDFTDAAKLWLPQLAPGRRDALNKLRTFVDPDDICPILPFPATDARLGDSLAEEYIAELESDWAVDMRDIVYADEGDPLDLYRTILRLDDRRKPVFEETGSSLLILSPLGSKIMSLGTLMAALDRDLPIAYLESVGYKLDDSVPAICDTPNLLHIWLEGDVYPRTALSEHGRGKA